MTPENFARIRKGWSAVVSAPEIVGQMFYDKLFTNVPQVRSMFPQDMAGQEAKLVQTLDFIIDNLDDMDTLAPVARDLAVRHVAYGTVPAHYTAVGEALIETLQQALGDDFSQEDKKAWTEVYTALANEMIAAAHSE